MPETVIEYFQLYGPFAVLFVFLFYWSLATSKERERIMREDSADRERMLREEIAAIRAESEERSKRHYEVLSQFAEKYDLIIDKLNGLETEIKRK